MHFKVLNSCLILNFSSNKVLYASETICMINISNLLMGTVITMEIHMCFTAFKVLTRDRWMANACNPNTQEGREGRRIYRSRGAWATCRILSQI